MAPRNSLVDGLAANLETLHILESKHDGPRFSPPSGFQRSLAVPRYLFRVCSGNSAGRTTPARVESASAASGYPASRTCLFALDARLAADMLDNHLRWRPTQAADNLVSWTSSLLTALVYVFYRRAHYPEPLGDIRLYVVDTWRFREGTFVGDLDLIRALMPHDASLAGLWGLRHKQCRGATGSYYFGEYLTQGSLGLAGRCASATAQQMVDAGLLELHPRFAEFARWAKLDAVWASLVVELREPFYARPGTGTGSRDVYANDAQIMSRIGDLFGVGWRAPVAVGLFSLAANRTGVVNVLLNFGHHGQRWDPDNENCVDSTTGVNPNNAAPEVEEYIYHLNDAYLQLCELTVRGHIHHVLDTLDLAQRLIRTVAGIQQPPRDFSSVVRRSDLFNLVRTLQGMAQKVLPKENVDDGACSDDEDSEAAGRDAYSS